MYSFEFHNSLIKAIYEASQQGILVVDNKGVIIFHNSKFVDIWRIPNDLLTGVETNSVIGLNDAAILMEALKLVKHPEAFLDRVKELYENPELTDHCEIALVDNRTLERRSIVLYNQEAALIGRAWFFLDITPQKEIEKKLKELTFQDPLTGVANRRYFFERADQEIMRSQRYLDPLSIALLDIDHFKQINDNYGHAAGDEILKAVTDCIQSLIRHVDVFARVGGTDVFARIGGEEFALLLPNTNLEQATQLAERIRHKIAAIKLPIKTGHISCTISIGIAMFRPTDTGVEDCMIRADKAMYSAKRHGRNRTEVEASDELF